MNAPKHIDLFSGIGGFSLAAEWAGFTTVLHCEKDAYCRKVLERHWPDVPISPDIHTLTGDIVRHHLAFDHRASDVRHTEGVQRKTIERHEPDADLQDHGCLPRVDLLTGGFPCQPFSVAGKQRGKDDDRHLWPQMLRVIEEVRPTWVCGENVAGFIRMALDDVLADLEAAGYEVQPVVLPACGVGAWHRRERIFILGRDASHTNEPRPQGYGYVGSERQGARERAAQAARANVPDAAHLGQQRAGSTWAGRPGLANSGARVTDSDREPPRWSPEPWSEPHIWESEPAVGRVAHGIPRRVDRLRALGNAVVPQVCYPILAAIHTEITTSHIKEPP